MRIWLATTSMGIGGAERLVVTLARGLGERGHDVVVWGRAGPLDVDLEPAGSGRRTVSQGPAVFDAVRIRRYPARSPRSGARPERPHDGGGASRAVGAPGPTPAGGHVPRGRAAGSPAGGRAASCAAPTPSPRCRPISGRALEDHGVPAARTTVVPTAAPPPPTVAASLAGELHPDPGPLLVTVGRLVPTKHARFLEAMAIIADRHPTARALVVGDGPERRALEERAKALGLGPRVRFTGWRHDGPSQPVADVAVFSSDSEGRSVVTVLEALAAGTPARHHAGTRDAGAGDGRRRHRHGRVLSHRTGRTAVSRLLDDPAARAAMGHAAEAVAETTSTEGMLDAYEALYAPSQPR